MKAVILLVLFLLAACVPQVPLGEKSTPAQPSIQNPFNPISGDESLLRGQAYVDLVQWNDPELVFKGSLPTPCNQMRLIFLPLTTDKHLNVEAYSVTKPDEVCTQVLQEFEATVTLTGLEKGDYILVVNDQEMLRFTMP